MKFIFTTLIFILCLISNAQKPTINGNFDHIADNREYYNPFGYPQTILGARLNLIISKKVDSL
ncbi:hypothetical protein ACFLSA_06880, partial [Bacteroidota bacterium]